MSEFPLEDDHIEDVLIQLRCSEQEYQDALNNPSLNIEDKFGNPVFDTLMEVAYCFVVYHMETGEPIPDEDLIIDTVRVITEKQEIDIIVALDSETKPNLFKNIRLYLENKELYEEAAEFRDYVNSLKSK